MKRLAASGKARFWVGFLAVTWLCVFGNVLTVLVAEDPWKLSFAELRDGKNQLGFPFTFFGGGASPFKRDLDEFALAGDVAVLLVGASGLGFWLYKFADPNQHVDYLCKGCGYDLRGIEPDVCPECGVAVNQDDELADS